MKIFPASVLLAVFLFLFFESQAQNRIPPEKPRLIIGIVVENMRSEYLYRYWDKFEKKGFKRLIGEGSFCKNASYEYLNTQSAPGYATIVAGCPPSVHGIVGNFFYDRKKDEMVDCCFDKKAKAVGNSSYSGKLSPEQLLTTTFADELKMMSLNRSKVISVSGNYQASILMGGHTADAAYWFDEMAGLWMTSNYYRKELPEWANTFNQKKLTDIYLKEMWNTLLPIGSYRESLPDNNPFEQGFGSNQKTFPYDIQKIKEKDKNYSILMKTPFGNSFTKDFALEAVINEKLGMDDTTDVLFISFSPFSEIENLFHTKSVEIEDAYLRFDKELAHLLDFIDEEIGKEKVLLFLTADCNGPLNPEILKENKLPVSSFKPANATVLLKAYLNAVYGPGDWVLKYHNQQFYLNNNLIEDAQLSVEDVQTKVALFLQQMGGVANAVTSSNLNQIDYTDGIFSKVQNSYSSKRSGDVFINFEPGWVEENENSINGKTGKTETIPLIWYGWKIKRNTINRPVSMFDLAPTISSLLNIPYPNGCEGKAILELVE
ncbi:MAG: alkaline phosphatase family protein [Bacteroidales bacterium]|nr:alkaline phosphatase family protein [Bacteroidales bacterium]MCF8455522.1 alkaline phosphatase family protein [Bacteroidales bacterium]